MGLPAKLKERLGPIVSTDSSYELSYFTTERFGLVFRFIPVLCFCTDEARKSGFAEAGGRYRKAGY